MLSRSDAFRRAVERDGSQPTALARITTAQLFTEVLTQSDWESGSQTGVASTTTTDSPLNDSQTTVNVVSTDLFSIPDGVAGQHEKSYIQINSEIISYTGITATSFTGCTRGVRGTTAATHSNGSTVTQTEYDSEAGTTVDLGIYIKYWFDDTASGGPPSDRKGHSLVYDNQSQQLILFGGSDGAASPTLNNEVWIYDIATTTWTQKTPTSPPTAREGHGAAWDSTNNVMVIHGGHDGTNYLADTYTYDPDNGAQGTWATVSSNGSVKRSNFCTCFNTDDNLVYVVGGDSDTSSGFRRTADSYDVGTDTWTRVSTETGPKQGSIGQGGFSISGSTIPVFGSVGGIGYRVRLFDVGSGTWSNGTVPPFGTVAMSETSSVWDDTGKRLIVIRQGNTASAAHTWSYNVGTGEWTRVGNYREKRRHAAAVWDTDNDMMLFWGGDAGTGATLTSPTYDGPQCFSWFFPNMTWVSATMDLGSAPTSNGTVIIDSTLPTTGSPTLDVSLEYSDDDVIWNDWDSGNPVSSGDTLTQQSRYWRATAAMTTDTSGTPLLQRVRVNFGTIETFAMASRPVFGYAPLVRNIPNQTSKVEPLTGKASISELKLQLINEGDLIRTLFKDAHIFNTTVELLVGFDEEDMTEYDYMPFLTGIIQDWDYDNDTLTISTRDPLDVLRREVPEASDGNLPGSGSQQVVYNASGTTHPIAIQKDLIENQANVNDIYIDGSTFDSVQVDSTLTDWKFIRTLVEPTETIKYIQEISRLTGAYVIPGENGKLRCSLYKPASDPVATWTERDIIMRSPRFKLQEKNLKNFIAVYYDGNGTSAADYTGVAVQTDATSITNWQKTSIENLYSNWIGSQGGTYVGDTRANDVASRLLTRYADGCPIITLQTGLEWMHLQVGELVFLSGGVTKGFEEWTVPYVARGVDLVRNMKFEIVQKKVQLTRGLVEWELWRAPEAISQDYNSQDDWVDNEFMSSGVDLESTPGSVDLDNVAADGLYELRVDLSQQHEQDLISTATVTTPGSTDIVIDAWGSHTGAWDGSDDVWLGADYINTGSDTVTDRYRYYRFVFNFINDGANVCSLDRFQLTGTR